MFIATMDGLIVPEHLVDHYYTFHMWRGAENSHSICSGKFWGSNRLCASIMHIFPIEDLEPGTDYWVDMDGYDADSEPAYEEPSRMHAALSFDISRLTGRLYETTDYV